MLYYICKSNTSVGIVPALRTTPQGLSLFLCYSSNLFSFRRNNLINSRFYFFKFFTPINNCIENIISISRSFKKPCGNHYFFASFSLKFLFLSPITSAILPIASITDKRLKPQIPTVKIITAIIIMHFSNLGSLNSLSQEIAFKNLKKAVPSVSTIARAADSLNLEEIRNIGIEIYARARKSKMLASCYGMWVGSSRCT